ncbi:hypothetical protein AGLY_006798 [Aphis glycines]|uniref:DUF7869 domain-containing protein n=1 Tax=Aphis glycines TaxID=307491 RepID=A0A6G0TSL3_APHGL|nr:hypothetical protein AGLY_006798 [Aphis glycines]
MPKKQSVHNERKIRRSEGKPYVTKKNVMVEGKKEPKEEISCKCKFHCRSVPYTQKKLLFHDFYALKDNCKQNSYLMGLMIITPVKRRRHGKYDDPMDSRRQVTVCFSMPDGTGNIIQNRSKFTDADKNLIIEHVNSFPRDESHYGRKKSKKEYLSQDLNISRLFRSFKDKFPDSPVTYRFFFETFKQKCPNISFHKPRTDTCSKCDLLSAEVAAKPRDKHTKNMLELHHKKAEKARQQMKQDTVLSQLPTSDICMFSMDLKQVLSLPSLTHSQMFYLRQLSCYNLGVHFGDSNRRHMFLWHEGMSGRGGNEIASCVFEALNSNPTVKRKLTIWSDNCVGQNKNKMLLFLWIYLTLTDKFDEINHKYLVSGHSFLSCDRDFAQIEKRKRVEKCEVPIDLVKLIVHATPNNSFIVTLLEPNNFYDFKKAADMYLNTGKLQISKCSWLKITKDKPGVVQTKTTFNELEAWRACKVIKKGVTVNTIEEMDLPSLVCENKISVEKKKDLQQMLPFLKDENKEFFEKLIK